MGNIFDGATFEFDIEAGFAWAEKDGENLFQVCIDEDGEINRKDSGYEWGICGDYNTLKHGDDYDNLKLIHDQFIKFAEDNGVKTYDCR